MGRSRIKSDGLKRPKSDNRWWKVEEPLHIGNKPWMEWEKAISEIDASIHYKTFLSRVLQIHSSEQEQNLTNTSAYVVYIHKIHKQLSNYNLYTRGSNRQVETEARPKQTWTSGSFIEDEHKPKALYRLLPIEINSEPKGSSSHDFWFQIYKTSWINDNLYCLNSRT